MKQQKNRAATRKGKQGSKRASTEPPRLSVRARKQKRLIDATLAGVVVIFVSITLLAVSLQEGNRGKVSASPIPAVSPDAASSAPVAIPVVNDAAATAAPEHGIFDLDEIPESLQSLIGPPATPSPNGAERDNAATAGDKEKVVNALPKI